MRSEAKNKMSNIKKEDIFFGEERAVRFQ